MIKRHPLKWLTKVEEKKLRKNYETNMKRFEAPYDEHEFLPVVHFFNPVGVGDWYITELSPENIAYGLCCLSEAEIGDVSLEPAAPGFAVCCLQFKTGSEYLKKKRQTGELRLIPKGTARSA